MFRLTHDESICRGYVLNASFMEQLAIVQLDRLVSNVGSVQRHAVSVVEQDVVLVSCCSQLTYLLLEGV